MVSVTNPKPTNPTVLKADSSGNDIQQWHIVDGTIRSRILNDGRFQTGYPIEITADLPFKGRFFHSYSAENNYPYLDAQLATGAMGFVARDATQRPLVVKGAASQTADLQQWQDSAGTVIVNIKPSGQTFFRNTGDSIVAVGSNNVISFALRGGTNELLRIYNSGIEQTTIGAAGAASALPSAPTKYLRVVDSAGTILVIPAYASA